MTQTNPWDERFSAEEFFYGTEPNLYLSEKLRKYHPALVLLPGEGEGRNAVFAASLGCDVYAFDQSRVAREKALRWASSRNLRIDYRLAGVLDADYPLSYFQMIGLVYLHLPPAVRSEAHRKLTPFLAPGGYIVLEAFHKSHLGNNFGPRDINMLYNEEELRSDFKDLDILELYSAQVQLNEGAGHYGNAVVVRLTARKN